MNLSKKSNQVRDDWIERPRELGNQPRAVLMKGVPILINGAIDRWHRAVMRAAFPRVASPPTGKPCLDLGCGYGRLADEATKQGLAPVIGIPLPFISYGGTSLLTFTIMLFILIRLDADRQMVLR